MTSRERVILVVMTGMVAWGGWSFYTDMRARSERRASPTTTTTPTLPTQAFADQQRSLLETLRLTPIEQTILAAAETDWPPTPFIDRITDPQAASSTRPLYFFSGYLQFDGKQFAILNGREYQAGDPVDASDWIVESIHPDHVILTSANRERQLTVAITDVSLQRKRP